MINGTRNNNHMTNIKTVANDTNIANITNIINTPAK